jgi:hypothetical protein
MVFRLIDNHFDNHSSGPPTHVLAIHLALECAQSPPIVSGTGAVVPANGEHHASTSPFGQIPQETYFDVL